MRWIALVFGLSALGALGAVGCARTPSAEGAPAAVDVEPVKLVVVREDAEAPSQPTALWKSPWETKTGERLQVTALDPKQAAGSLIADAEKTPPALDGAVVPAFLLGELVAKGLVESTQTWRERRDLATWRAESVVPAVSHLLKWGEIDQAIPYDANPVYLCYRKDVLGSPTWKEAFEKKFGRQPNLPPRDWKELNEWRQLLAGQDWNGNGAKDDALIAMEWNEGQSHWMFLSIAAPFVTNPGPKPSRDHQLSLLDPETLEPRLATPGFALALELFRALAGSNAVAAPAPPAPSANGGKSLRLYGGSEGFLQGKALFGWTQVDLARAAQDESRSVVKGKLGCCVIPGSSRVWSFKHKEWKNLSQPNVVGNVNGPNCVGVVFAKSPRREQAYDFLAFQANRLQNMSSVTRADSVLGLSRSHQFLKPAGDAEATAYAGFCESDITEYSRAIYENYYRTSATMEYLRLPGAAELYAALDRGIVKYLSSPDASATAILESVAKEWTAILSAVSQRVGADRLKALHQESVGYQTPKN